MNISILEKEDLTMNKWSETPSNLKYFNSEISYSSITNDQEVTNYWKEEKEVSNLLGEEDDEKVEFLAFHGEPLGQKYPSNPQEWIEKKDNSITVVHHGMFSLF